MIHPGGWMISHNLTAFIYFVHSGEQWHYRVKLSFSKIQQKEVNYLALIIYLGTINHGFIPHKRGLCSLEQEERRGGCYCLLIMQHQIG